MLFFDLLFSHRCLITCKKKMQDSLSIPLHMKQPRQLLRGHHEALTNRKTTVLILMNDILIATCELLVRRPGSSSCGGYGENKITRRLRSEEKQTDVSRVHSHWRRSLPDRVL
jgi:hypothetical protein